MKGLPFLPCNQQPKTLSFRNSPKNIIFKTMNSIYSSSPDQDSAADDLETMIRGLKSSKRLFFEAKGETSSILEEDSSKKKSSFEGSTTMLTLVSGDPYVDFRKSMEEMVQVYELKDWGNLEELLCWYLRVNERCNHGYVFGAFVDLLVGLALNDDTTIITTTTTTGTTTTTSSCSCSCFNNQDSPSSPISNFYTSFSSDDEESCSRIVPVKEGDDVDKI